MIFCLINKPMGLIKTILIVSVPLNAYAMYTAYRLGPKLPLICRKTGNYLGLFY